MCLKRCGRQVYYKFLKNIHANRKIVILTAFLAVLDDRNVSSGSVFLLLINFPMILVTF